MRCLAHRDRPNARRRDTDLFYQLLPRIATETPGFRHFCSLLLEFSLLGEHRHAGVCDLAAQTLAADGLHSGLHALIAHDIGILGHGGQEIAVVDEAQDGVGLVEAHTEATGNAGSLEALPTPVVEPSLQPKMPATTRINFTSILQYLPFDFYMVAVFFSRIQN